MPKYRGVDDRMRKSEKERLREIAIICRERIKDLPRADRIRVWRRCLEEYLMR